MSGTLIAIIIFIILLLAGFIIAGFLTNWFGLIDDSTVKPPAVTPSVAPTAATPSVAPSATSTVTPSALSGYIEGRYIKLTRTNSENKPLNISEISVFDTSNNKITQLTGSLSPVSSDFGWMGPELLFNNNLDDFAHTGDSTTASITVDLGSNKKIKKIIINNRKDICCSDRIIGTTLTVQKADQTITFKKNINSVQAEFIYTNLDTISDII
jgi:hypothetical protein